MFQKESTSGERPGGRHGARAEDIHMFDGCDFQHNVASLGGALCFSTDNLQVNFGPGCTFSRNFASEMGGALFVEQSLGNRQFFMSGATFSDNEAQWAGCNAAWFSVYDSNTAGDFCGNCEITVPAGAMGYQDDRGFATSPGQARMVQACPGTEPLDAATFNADVELYDQFGTLVNGTILLDNVFTVELTSSSANGCHTSCPTSTANVTFPSTTASIYNVSMMGQDNSTCEIVFNCMSSPIETTVEPAECSVLLEGCAEGYEVVPGDNGFDTCAQISATAPITLILVLVIIGLIFAIAIVLLIAGVVYYRRTRFDRYLEGLEMPDILSRPSEVTICSILNDPDILVVPWDEVVKGEQLGIGASGVVSKGYWNKPQPEAPVELAIKELRFGFDQWQKETLEQFLVEIKLMSALVHDNIVQLLGIAYEESSRTIYLLAELMEYGSMRDLISSRGSNLPWKLRIKLAKDAAKGIAYLHSRKVIHRDLKSQNLLVNSKWVCKVADFGISTVKSHTRTMTCIGTPVYMAPEVISKSKYSEKADVYSFGIFLIELYTGAYPYSEDAYKSWNNAQLMFQIIQNNLRPDVSSLPGTLQQLVLDCLSEDPRLRPTFPEIVVRLRRMQNAEVDVPDAPPIDADLHASSSERSLSQGSTGKLLLQSQELRALKDSFEAMQTVPADVDLMGAELQPVLGMDSGERDPLL